MTRDRKVQLATIAVLVAALSVAVVRKTALRRAVEAAREPEDTVYAMLDAARTGDVTGYLACYTEPLASGLRQALAESGEPAFARYLRDSHAALKGAAVSDPQPVTGSEVTVRVEYVYQDRNEAQTLYLQKGSKGWKISRADSDQRVRTLIPYGTPVK